jgi:hypothetical protein
MMKTMKFVLLVASLTLGLLAEVAQGHLHAASDGGKVHRCGAKDATLSEAAIEQLRIQAFQADPGNRRHLQVDSCDNLCDQCIEIEVTLVLAAVENLDDPFVPHPNAAIDRLILQDPTITVEDFSTTADIIALFEQNMAVVNAAFVGTPFRFGYAGIDATTVVPNTE